MVSTASVERENGGRCPFSEYDNFSAGLPFDRLAQLEARGELTEAGSPKAGEGKLKVEGEPEDDPENVDVDEPDEEDFEDDDYLQVMALPDSSFPIIFSHVLASGPCFRHSTSLVC